MDASPLDVVLFSLAFCSDSLHFMGERGRGVCGGGRRGRGGGGRIRNPGGILSDEHL